jgi:hypothetical protein
MSNETSHNNNHQSESTQPAISFKASFWVIVILVGLFICALNFIKIMSSEGEEGKEGAKTEMSKPSEKTEKTAEKPADTAPKADIPQNEKH